MIGIERDLQAEDRTIIPETRIGHGRKKSALREVILCIDQSGSMATSVVYAGIFGAVLASLVAPATDAVFALDTERSILTWNPGAERIFGYTADEAIGRDARELLLDGPLDGVPAPRRAAGSGPAGWSAC